MSGVRAVGARRGALGLAAVVAAVLVGAAAAFACTPQAGITLSVDTGAPGSVVTVDGVRWDADSAAPVVLRWAGVNGPEIGRATLERAETGGVFTTQVRIPFDAFNGPQLIMAVQWKADGSNLWTASDDLRVVGGVDPPPRPTTTAPPQEPVAEEPAPTEPQVVPTTAVTTPAARPRPPAAQPAPSPTAAPVAEVAVDQPAVTEPAPPVLAAPAAPPGDALAPVSSGGQLPLVVSDPSALGGPRTTGSGPSAAVVLMLAVLGVGLFATGTTLVVRDVRARRVKTDS